MAERMALSGRVRDQGHRNIVKRKGHILVVEPDDLIRDLLGRWLSEAGYVVVFQDLHKLSEPRNGEPPPELVIADVPSPHGAPKLIQSLREVYASPILLVSARFRRGLGSSTAVARQLGVRKIVPKPFTRAELLMAVNESIEAP